MQFRENGDDKLLRGGGKHVTEIEIGTLSKQWSKLDIKAVGVDNCRFVL